MKRVYDPIHTDDGYRVLIDRLWPRGLKKETAGIDLWFKDIAPSPDLRKWFDHKPDRFDAFKLRYRSEIEGTDTLRRFKDIVKSHDHVTLLYAAKDPQVNHARVLKSILEQG